VLLATRQAALQIAAAAAAEFFTSFLANVQRHGPLSQVHVGDWHQPSTKSLSTGDA